MLSGVLRGESPAVDARPALSTSDSTWLDGPRPDAACPGFCRLALWRLPWGHPPSSGRGQAWPAPHVRERWPYLAPRPPWSTASRLLEGSPGCPQAHDTLGRAPQWSESHAAHSPEAMRGGAPPRGMTPVHTSRWPQVGHRSGWASPRCAPTVCQSSAAGTSSGGWPSAARQTARTAAWLGWYSPYDRTTRVWGIGTCSSQRWRKSATGKVISWIPGRTPSASSGRAREVQVTRAPSYATKRPFLMGPPRRDRARYVTTPAPWR